MRGREFDMAVVEVMARTKRVIVSSVPVPESSRAFTYADTYSYYIYTHIRRCELHMREYVGKQRERFHEGGHEVHISLYPHITSFPVE